MPVILASDLIVFFLFAVCAYLCIKARKKHAPLRLALSQLKRNRLAMASMALLALFAVIALLDSIRYRDAIETDRTPHSKTLYSPKALSLIDRIFEGPRTNAEKTYSAPMASRLFVKETVTLPDGSTKREFPALKHPSGHILGTDKVGSDVFFTAIKGIRTGIVIGAGTTIVIIPFAIFFGVVAGYFGGIIDDVVQYLYTTLSSIPGVLLIVAFMLLFGTSGYQGGLVSEEDAFLKIFVLNDRLFWLCLILGITSWTDLCRIVRGETLKLRELDYVLASRAFGARHLRIIYRHIVPNLLHLVLITFVLQFSSLVLAEAVLSYIGIGVGPEMGSWGNMINTARLELSREPAVWWNLFAAFLFMFALVLPANIFGDAVRDALDPRLRFRSF